MKHPRYSNLYEAIIVARSDEDDTEFLNKTVEENMKVAHIVIPVITKKSYKEQWMNQEIGYAVAKKKIVHPIVEKSTIKKLKGFYTNYRKYVNTYSANSDEQIEREVFDGVFRSLLRNLEKDIAVIKEFTKHKIPYDQQPKRTIKQIEYQSWQLDNHTAELGEIIPTWQQQGNSYELVGVKIPLIKHTNSVTGQQHESNIINYLHTSGNEKWRAELKILNFTKEGDVSFDFRHTNEHGDWHDSPNMNYNDWQGKFTPVIVRSMKLVKGRKGQMSFDFNF